MAIENFTPLPAVIGGALIGLASVWLLIANGRIAGVSGILHGLFAGDRLWRAWFIAGLIVAGFAWHAFAGPAPIRQGFGLGWVALAGPRRPIARGLPDVVAPPSLALAGSWGCRKGAGLWLKPSRQSLARGGDGFGGNFEAGRTVAAGVLIADAEDLRSAPGEEPGHRDVSQNTVEVPSGGYVGGGDGRIRQAEHGLAVLEAQLFAGARSALE